VYKIGLNNMENQILQIIQQSKVQARDYQIRIISKTLTALQQNIRSILIESPTGSGKTLTCLIILKLLEQNHPQMKFIWTTIRHKLLKQAELENQKIGVKNIQFMSIFNKTPPESDLIIEDEAQHSAANSCLSFQNKTKAKLGIGLTATPLRTDKLKLAYDKTISDYGVKFLIESGYLAPYDRYVIPQYTVKQVSERYLESPEKWGKSIFFMKDTQECYHLESILKNRGISCSTILGEMPYSQQDDILNAAEEGKINALINVYLLTEGYDDHKLQTVWIRDNSKLPTMQMVGRALRKDPDNPQKVANVIQSSHTPYPYIRTATPRQEFIYSDKWLSVQSNKQVKTVMSNVMRDLMMRV